MAVNGKSELRVKIGYLMLYVLPDTIKIHMNGYGNFMRKRK